ncbi:MAG: putative flavoprotein involved in K+ transport [Rhodobacteraceae bacterium]|uniref:flavin-containing monooxygenase n=1 Tax=Cypionkella sp. TaxID=2811411 RepID=UPI001321EBC6|nr:NAD(P)/FAD-dependent oxidoreductase [Cypionkella sp.]KAF0172198.1 MAG: putative flavoprotein involved in K+ transport [Paracoccaceae bacterium]MDO8327690.1 NAD(P)/FAD-dependent oxidoreductase [Cypionkella sp.]
MPPEKIDTLIIGGGQAGLAMSAHLDKHGVNHLVLERHRIAERWRSERWDSLVANGPAWHDRFPSLEFDGIDPDSFAPRDRIVSYFETFAQQINAPIRCGVNVTAVQKNPDGTGFRVETSDGVIEAANVVAATGPFQRPIIPTVVPAETGIMQIHSSGYRNPAQLPEGAVLVVGAGSSGAQIADELQRAGKKVYLSVGPHDRPPRAYRGRDFVWWLGALGHWNAKTREPGMEHVTISVSGARGGHTVDFRDLAASGITLTGRAETCQDGVMQFRPDLAANIAAGDANYLSVLDTADAYAAAHGLDLPPEPEARNIGPDPDCVRNPLLQLNLTEAGITSIVWATGFTLDFGWLQLDAFDDVGRPQHDRGISNVPGLYFLGLPWLSRRASPFIWGVWHDAEFLAGHIAAR